MLPSAYCFQMLPLMASTMCRKHGMIRSWTRHGEGRTLYSPFNVTDCYVVQLGTSNYMIHFSSYHENRNWMESWSTKKVLPFPREGYICWWGSSTCWQRARLVARGHNDVSQRDILTRESHSLTHFEEEAHREAREGGRRWLPICW